MTSHFEAQTLITEVQSYGATIYAESGKVRVKGASKLPTPLIEKIKERRDDVLAVLTVPRLPWQLERLISAACSGALQIRVEGVPDTTRYVQAWACAYLTGDRDEPLKRLWEVYKQWQKNKN
ncbi:MAG: hypothetical protein ACRCYY_00350 [Trueperaceae bacterium]